jgi:hypothetical protein
MTVRSLSRNRDIEWFWVRSDVIIFLLLAGLGAAAGATFPFVWWAVEWPAGRQQLERHPSDQSVYSARVCSDLGPHCM